MSWSRHLTRGLRLLGERRYTAARRWIEAGDSGFDKAVRMVMVSAGGYVLWRVVASSWKVLAATVLLVMVLALRAATKAATKAAKAPPSKAPEGPGELSPGEFLTVVWGALGDANAVHLNTLAAALTDAYRGAWKVADVRRLCEAAGVAVTPTVRAPGGKPTVGVYRADVPPLPRPSPEVAPVAGGSVVAAGQDATTGAGTTRAAPTTTTHGDVRVVAVDDPGNPRRTRVMVTMMGRSRARREA